MINKKTLKCKFKKKHTTICMRQKRFFSTFYSKPRSCGVLGCAPTNMGFVHLASLSLAPVKS